MVLNMLVVGGGNRLIRVLMMEFRVDICNFRVAFTTENEFLYNYLSNRSLGSSRASVCWSSLRTSQD